MVDVFKVSGIKHGLLERAAETLYEDARCGFFHDGLFRKKKFFVRGDIPDLFITLPKINGIIDEDGEIQSILVNTEKCYFAIKQHVDSYVRDLRNPNNTQLRTIFRSYCKQNWNWEKDGPVIGLNDPFFFNSEAAQHRSNVICLEYKLWVG